MKKSCRIVEPEVKCMVTGLKGSEGPVFTPDGSFYMVAPEEEDSNGKPAGQVIRVNLTACTTEVVCRPSMGGYGGIPAGCQSDKDGLLWVADMRLGLLQIQPDSGKYQQMAKRDWKFQPMQGCNDCAFDNEGNLWVTAPAGIMAPSEYRRSMKEAFGSIYCFTKDDGLGSKMVKVSTGYLFPNGIAVQNDRNGKAKNLIVAETGAKQLWSFPFDSTDDDCKIDVSKRSSFGHCPGHHEGGPDGMDFDCEGNLLVANWGSGYIDVFGQFGGQPHTRIKLPFKKVSNLHFKPSSKQVFVTEHDQHGLWTFEWEYEGAKQFCDL